MSPETKPVVSLLLAVALLAAAPAGAEESRSGLAWLSGDAIREAFSGQPLAGIYPSEKTWAETIRADGTSDYREGQNHWQGRWWIRDREFCFSYPPPGVGGCFRVTRISANCFELYEFESPHAGEDTPPELANLWNGRMWRADLPTTCERPTV
ncbi:MAG: hypothetical protein AB7O57_06550 [Hyphomicrobiaceae bacterium]